MKSLLDLVNDCDQFPSGSDTSSYYKFQIQDHTAVFGYILPSIISTIPWPDPFWTCNDATKTLTLHGTTEQQRTANILTTFAAARDRKSTTLLKHWTAEALPLYGPSKVLLAHVPRAVVPLLGMLAYGIQMLAYEPPSEAQPEYRLWIARRAISKRTFPGMLDVTVGGAMASGETPLGCLLREADEEARLGEDLVRERSKACGTVSYVTKTDGRYGKGGEMGFLVPEVEFSYEIVLPKGVVPVPGDGEVHEFVLMGVGEVKERLGRGEFTPVNGVMVIDFLIRHGVVTFENEGNYLEILGRLHQVMEFPVM